LLERADSEAQPFLSVCVPEMVQMTFEEPSSRPESSAARAETPSTRPETRLDAASRLGFHEDGYSESVMSDSHSIRGSEGHRRPSKDSTAKVNDRLLQIRTPGQTAERRIQTRAAAKDSERHTARGTFAQGAASADYACPGDGREERNRYMRRYADNMPKSSAQAPVRKRVAISPEKYASFGMSSMPPSPRASEMKRQAFTKKRSFVVTSKADNVAGRGGGLRSLVLTCNQKGTAAIQQGDLKTAHEHLRYAEALIMASQFHDGLESLETVTYNNLGCLLRRQGKYSAACSYMRKALRAEVSLNSDCTSIASTHLNIARVLSLNNRHEKAAQHALCALEMCGRKVADTKLTSGVDDYAVLAMTYFTLAREQEHLEEWNNAATSYRQAHQVSSRFLGEVHPMTQMLDDKSEMMVQVATKAHGDHVADCMSPNSSTPWMRVENARTAPSESDPNSPCRRFDHMGTARTNFKENPRLLSKMTMGAAAMGADSTASGSWMAFVMQALPDPPGFGSQQGVDAKHLPGRPLKDAFFSVDDKKTRISVLKKQASNKGIQDCCLTNGPDVNEHQEKKGRSQLRSTMYDIRPNRLLVGPTRTNLLIRRDRVNETEHRDAVIQEKLDSMIVPKTTAEHQVAAATTIQRIWRQWCQYMSESYEYQCIAAVCSLIIQTYWRKWHYRIRLGQDRAANKLQRVMKGWMVRQHVRKHKGARDFQKMGMGMVTRMKLDVLQAAALTIQRVFRGWSDRLAVSELVRAECRAAIFLQRLWRTRLRLRKLAQEKFELEEYVLLVLSATRVQVYFRGNTARKRCKMLRNQEKARMVIHVKAARIQGLFRMRVAKAFVSEVRQTKLANMKSAATTIRADWLCYVSRKWYLSLLRWYQQQVTAILTIQRYIRRNFEAVRQQKYNERKRQLLLSAVLIQREFRGKEGRKYHRDIIEDEVVCNYSAVRIQNLVRGWLIRLQWRRSFRQRKREEFLRTRRRFEAARTIQSALRRLFAVKLVQRRRRRETESCVVITSKWHGHERRQALSDHVELLKLIVIQSLVRGFLVRRRLRRMRRGTLAIQHAYRHWLLAVPVERRCEKVGQNCQRSEAAKLIQQHARVYLRYINGEQTKKLATSLMQCVLARRPSLGDQRFRTEGPQVSALEYVPRGRTSIVDMR